MVWKTWSGSDNYRESPPVSAIPKRRTTGDIIASVGNKTTLSVERLLKIDDNLLGYNLDGKKVLLRIEKNDRAFDIYASLPFTKGVTERETGRTLLIVGSNLHHIAAMQYQFNGVLWTKEDNKEIKKYGDTIRWINVGDTVNGFIGLDYDSHAKSISGVATSASDVQFLAQTLLSAGYDPKKKIYLLKPPYIVEREEGKKLRSQGIETLIDAATKSTTL